MIDESFTALLQASSFSHNFNFHLTCQLSGLMFSPVFFVIIIVIKFLRVFTACPLSRIPQSIVPHQKLAEKNFFLYFT